MIIKSLLATAAVAGTVLTASTAAKAGTDVDIYLGFGDVGYSDTGYGWTEDYGDGYSYRGHRRDRGWRLSCSEGREKVRWAGFRKVRPIDCDGRSYAYKARRDGDWYIVTVNSRRGRIVDVSPAY